MIEDDEGRAAVSIRACDALHPEITRPGVSMKPRNVFSVIALLALALSGCAQQQPSAFEATVPKLRDQCVAGDNQACLKIAQGACLNGTPETCRADCWPANVAQACAPYRTDQRGLQGPGMGSQL